MPCCCESNVQCTMLLGLIFIVSDFGNGVFNIFANYTNLHLIVPAFLGAAINLILYIGCLLYTSDAADE